MCLTFFVNLRSLLMCRLFRLLKILGNVVDLRARYALYPSFQQIVLLNHLTNLLVLLMLCYFFVAFLQTATTEFLLLQYSYAFGQCHLLQLYLLDLTVGMFFVQHRIAQEQMQHLYQQLQQTCLSLCLLYQTYQQTY